MPLDVIAFFGHFHFSFLTVRPAPPSVQSTLPRVYLLHEVLLVFVVLFLVLFADGWRPDDQWLLAVGLVL